MPGSVLGTGDRVINQANMVPAFTSVLEYGIVVLKLGSR